jgi:hypothetical protein
MNVIEDDGNSRGGRVDYDKLDVMQKVRKHLDSRPAGAFFCW